MRKPEEITKEVIKIYRESGKEAREYLRKARKLKEKFGSGLAVTYCWFYSVPQKWTQVEPKIFELAKKTNSFHLDTVLTIPKKNLAATLKPMIFRNEISSQLKNFCKAIKSEYSSWDNFADALKKESFFGIFGKLRKYKNIRLTFKNLAAMKIFVGMDNDLIILDTHVAKALGIKKSERSRYITRGTTLQNLLDFSKEITNGLRKKGFSDVFTAKWSLAIWFNKTNTHADELLKDTEFINR